VDGASFSTTRGWKGIGGRGGGGEDVSGCCIGFGLPPNQVLTRLPVRRSMDFDRVVSTYWLSLLRNRKSVRNILCVSEGMGSEIPMIVPFEERG
jgi:hypothetical protein